MANPAVLLLLAAVLWTLATLAAPLMPALVAGPVYAAAGLVCHQRPDRTLHLASGPMAVCARCFGLYLGALIGFAAVVLRRRQIEPLARPLGVIAVCAIPTAATLAAEWLLEWPVGNTSRLAAAVPLGLGVALTIGAAVSADSRRASAGPQVVR